MLVLKNRYKYLSIFLLIAFTSCSSSEELLHPVEYYAYMRTNKAQKQVVAAQEEYESEYQEQTRERDRQIAYKYPQLQLKYADMLGVIPVFITNLSLYKFIDEWYGVRYRLGGSTKAGIDCSAFVQQLFLAVYDLDVVRTAFDQFNNCWLETDFAKMREGDLVFFKTRGSRISHVGVYLMNRFFVHASSSQGVMISSLDDEYWVRRFAGAGRIPH